LNFFLAFLTSSSSSSSCASFNLFENGRTIQGKAERKSLEWLEEKWWLCCVFLFFGGSQREMRSRSKVGFFFLSFSLSFSFRSLFTPPPVVQQVRVVDPGDLQDALSDRRVRHGGRGGACRDAEPAAGAAAAAARPDGGAARARGRRGRSLRVSCSSSFCRRRILRVLLLL
jgi:hypothetical protein